MTAPTRKGPLLESAACRCCGNTKRCRILNEEYEWQGQKEVYTDIFVDCFGLLLSHLDGDENEKAICATCVSRLREAYLFRRQVLQCEEKLLQTNFQLSDEKLRADVKIEVEVEDVMKCPPSETWVNTPAANDDMNQDDSQDYEEEQEELKPVKEESTLEITVPIKHEKKKKISKTKLTKRKSKVAKTKAKISCKVKNGPKKNIDVVEPAQESNPKQLDNAVKVYHNTVSVIECSYVCPFYTSFSDYFCVYCRNTFIDPEKLREHVSHHDPSTYKTLFDNRKMAQIDITRIDCRLCPAVIDNIQTLKHHLQTTHQKELHQVTNEFLTFKLTANNISCIECGTSFKFFHALKKHMAEHFGSCICDICGAHYFDERVLQIHQKTHQKDYDEIFACNICGKQFKSRHNRYIHEAKVHKKEAAYPCSKCDDIFFSYAQRYRHLLNVHGEERIFRCDTCDRVYDSRKSLREHTRRTHLKIMKHQCDICDKRFYLPSRLKEHLSTHTGERNFRCEYCGKSYPRMRGLKVHMQSQHMVEKKYKCVICNAGFTQNVNLKSHMKRQHQALDMDEGFAVP